MAELRAPDPTLDALCESGEQPRLVYTTNPGADVPVFHRQTARGYRVEDDHSPDCGTVDHLKMTSPMHVKHARRIGVPCREPGCFPGAPLPGRVPDGGGYGTPVAFLGWQVP